MVESMWLVKVVHALIFFEFSSIFVEEGQKVSAFEFRKQK